MEKKSAIIKPVSHEFYIILTIKNCKDKPIAAASESPWLSLLLIK